MREKTENEILLSIITINYNNAFGLRKTLSSVAGQSFKNYEHIIIDGLSTDDSKNVIEEFLKNEDYAHHVSFWCSEKDSGIYNAMNKGILHASGKYLLMLNSGDELYENSLQETKKYLENNEDCVIYGAVDCYDGESFKGTICGSAEQLDTGMIPHPASFISLSLHNQYGLYDESFKITADRALLIKLKRNSVHFTHIPVIVSKFYVDGVSSNNDKLLRKENLKINYSNFSNAKILFYKLKHIVKIFLDLVLPGFLDILLNLVVKFIKNRRKNEKRRT